MTAEAVFLLLYAVCSFQPAHTIPLPDRVICERVQKLVHKDPEVGRVIHASECVDKEKLSKMKHPDRCCDEFCSGQ